MQRDGAALALLAWSLLLLLVGLALLVRGSARRAVLAERGRLAVDEPLGSRLAGRLDAHLRRSGLGRRLHVWLRSTGSTIRLLDFLGLCLAGLVAGTVLCSFVVARGVALVVSALAVALAARAWGERRRAQRRDAFIAQLPDLARMLSNGASAGLSLAASVGLAAREMPDPAGEEMRAVVEQVRLGQPLDAALERLRERLPSREVAVLMSTLVIQHRAGGDTVRALAELGATLDARKDLLREIRTLMAGAVFSSWAVAGLGAVTLLMLNAIDGDILRTMTSSLLGILAFVVAGTMWAVAFVLIRRITRVDA